MSLGHSECEENACLGLAQLDSLNTVMKKHDVEVCHKAYGEKDLRKSLTMCRKNPGHKGFSPARNFSRHCLPPRYWKTNVVGAISYLSTLTVRVKANFVSYDRSANDDLYDIRGTDQFSRNGSGWVWHVDRCDAEKNTYLRFCLCRLCRENKNREIEDWGLIYINTCKHVVFDDSEALRTEFELFFDDHNALQNKRTVYGLSVEYSDSHRDFCTVVAGTHDMDLWHKLEQLLESNSALKNVLHVPCLQSEPYLVVIISHPHGCEKQISVGECTGRQDLGKVPGKNQDEACPHMVQYTYSTSTCQGSSGAPVLIIGRTNWIYTLIPHKGVDAEGNNCSGLGSEIKDNEMCAATCYNYLHLPSRPDLSLAHARAVQIRSNLPLQFPPRSSPFSFRHFQSSSSSSTYPERLSSSPPQTPALNSSNLFLPLPSWSRSLSNSDGPWSSLPLSRSPSIVSECQLPDMKNKSEVLPSTLPPPSPSTSREASTEDSACRRSRNRKPIFVSDFGMRCCFPLD